MGEVNPPSSELQGLILSGESANASMAAASRTSHDVSSLSSDDGGVLVVSEGAGGSGFTNVQKLKAYIRKEVARLNSSHPTEENMQNGARLLEYLKTIAGDNANIDQLKLKIIEYIENLPDVDVKTNIAIGTNGAGAIIKSNGGANGKLNILTHCNTGTLGTSGFGTALRVIRTLHQVGKLGHCFFTETRPYNRGLRLTSFESLYDKITSTIICDSAVSWLMKTKEIHGVVVGADKIAKNGDTANKTGTYQLAMIANAYNVPFFVAAPFSTIDSNIESGDSITFEDMRVNEVTFEGLSAWNPEFDVTPKDLIAGIITEKFVLRPDDLKAYLDQF